MTTDDIAELNKIGTRLLNIVAIFPQLIHVCLPRKPIDVTVEGWKEKLQVISEPYQFIFEWLNNFYKMLPKLFSANSEDYESDIPLNTHTSAEWEKFLSFFTAIEEDYAETIEFEHPFYLAFKIKFMLAFQILAEIELVISNDKYTKSQKSTNTRAYNESIAKIHNLAHELVLNYFDLILFKKVTPPSTPPTPRSFSDDEDDDGDNENDDPNATLQINSDILPLSALGRRYSLLGLYQAQEKQLATSTNLALVPAGQFQADQDLKRHFTY